MKKIKLKKAALVLVAATLGVMLTGCAESQEAEGERNTSSTEITISSETQTDSPINVRSTVTEEPGDPAAASQLEIRFGDDGTPFVIQLDDNETAAAIARHVGTSNWRLPIYQYDGFDHWEVMQYYDIPDRYEIPSNPETVTSEQAGEVYYSQPNRIILFYQDTEVTGDYTKIGTIENTDEFRNAVENNPVLEGWGNKIIQINSME